MFTWKDIRLLVVLCLHPPVHCGRVSPCFSVPVPNYILISAGDVGKWEYQEVH